MFEKNIQRAGPTKQRGWAGMRVGALFCLDLPTHILDQKLSFWPFFFIKLKIPACREKKNKMYDTATMDSTADFATPPGFLGLEFVFL